MHRSCGFAKASGALQVGRELGKDATLLINLSGRGDKDVVTAAEYFGIPL